MTHQISPLTFSECCLLLQTDQAELALAQISESPSLQPAEQTYLRAWRAAELRQWEKLSSYLLILDGPAIESYRTKMKGTTVRRRRSWMCWLLGNLAMQVKRPEDAFGWYTRCVQYLDERRMNDTRLRVHALCGRGMALLQMGAFPAGLGEFELAFELCQKRGLYEQEVYAGLCEAHFHLNHLELALLYGRKALPMTNDVRRRNALRLLLGNLYAQSGEDSKAATLCFEALDVARQDEQHDEAAQSLHLLAELDARKGLVSSARLFCEQALLHAHHGSPGVRGSLYLLCGKLALAEEKPEEATRWYSLAAQLFASPETGIGESQGLAEAHSALARICEASGHLEEASFHWKAAYQAGHPVSSEG